MDGKARTHRFQIKGRRPANGEGLISGGGEGENTRMDKAFREADKNGQAYFHMGKTRVKITERFPEEGKTIGKLMEELLLHTAREDERANGVGTA